MNELLLIVIDRRQPRGVAAAAVESVVELESLIPVPRAPVASRRPVGPAQPRADGNRLPALAGAGRDRVSTTASCTKQRSSSLTAIITRCTVDAVEDVVEALSDPAPIRAAMGDGLGARIERHGQRPRKVRCCWSTLPPVIAGPGAEARAA